MVTSRKTFCAAALFALVTTLLFSGFAQDENDEKDKKGEKFYANIGGGGARAIEL